VILDEAVIGFLQKVAIGAGLVLGLIAVVGSRIPRRIKTSAFLRSRN
jgi:hypothetical protein